MRYFDAIIGNIVYQLVAFTDNSDYFSFPGLRLSLTADRPFTTFKANAFTPELSDSQGWDTEVYPLTSTYTLGLKIDF